MPRWRSLALALAAALVLAACRPAPSIRPSSASGAPSGTGSASGPAPSVASAGLADALRDAIDPADILADLEQLQAIADANGGNRAAGTKGFDASAAYVADQLRAAGYEVTLQPVALSSFVQEAPSVLAIEAPGAPQLEDLRDFKAMLYSATGDVTAKVVTLGFDPAAQPGDRNGLGCNPADWASVAAGTIVLVQPGPCRRYDVVLQAQVAGALALVTAYPEWDKDHVLRPTLVVPDAITIPVLGGTRSAGLALAQAAQAGTLVHLATMTSSKRVESMNVIGETPAGDPTHVLMVGGHLDTAYDGPGINDNGSGTMAALEIARELAMVAGTTAQGGQAWKVRVAFWTGEEIALLGSLHYVDELEPGATDTIQAYLNLDMLGSPNGIRAAYDGDGATNSAGSKAITGLFGQALGAAGLQWVAESVGGPTSDHFAFDQAGIAIGGLFAGATGVKSAEEATQFGGTAGAPEDACYHLACDTVDNIDPVLLEQLARAGAWLVGELASGEVPLAPS